MSLSAGTLWLIGAVLAQGALALGLLFYLGSIRVPMILRGEVRTEAIAVNREGWPKREWQVSNAFDNQFQLPVLFYVAAALALCSDRHCSKSGWLGCSSSPATCMPSSTSPTTM